MINLHDHFFSFVFWCESVNAIASHCTLFQENSAHLDQYCGAVTSFSMISLLQVISKLTVAIEKSLLRRRLERWKIWQINWSTLSISWTLSRVNEKKFYITGVWHNQRCIKTHIFLTCKLILQGYTVLELNKCTSTKKKSHFSLLFSEVKEKRKAHFWVFTSASF